MKKVLKIDSNGYFLEDVLLEDTEITPLDCTEVVCAEGFYKPRLVGCEWVEGLTQPEMDTIKATIQQKPTELDRLEAIEMVLTAMMGV